LVVGILGLHLTFFRGGREIFGGVIKFGRSVVMCEYNSFCMLESGVVIFGFSKWIFCSLYRSIDYKYWVGAFN
jgi:hypothetical protein